MVRPRIAIIFLLILSTLCLSGRAQLNDGLSQVLSQEIQGLLTEAHEFEESGNLSMAAFNLNRAATIYWVNGHHSEAIELFKRTISLNETIGNQNALITLNNSIGMVYTDLEDYSNALKYFNNSLSLARAGKRKQEVAAILLNIGNSLIEQEEYSLAATNIEESHSIALEFNDELLLRNCYAKLTEVYDKLGNAEKSAEYFSLYTAISGKIQREKMRQQDSKAKKIVADAKTKVAEIEQAKELTEKELSKKQQALRATEESLEQIEQLTKDQLMQIELLNKEQELKDATIRNQRLVRNVFLLILFVVFIVTGFISYSLMAKKKANQKLKAQNIEIAKQKELIEEANKDLEYAFNQIEKQNRNITSSINYAQRIQEALLPPTENLSVFKDNAFILFKPRDIVSGDFYWFTGYGTPNSINQEVNENFIELHNIEDHEKGFLISAVDCTGHGVPGAFMSMIGFNLLENITRRGVVMPNKILEYLHVAIRHLLKQDKSEIRDGMDMAICNIVDNGRRILYAGAKNPLLYIQNGELTYLRGDPLPVGGMQKEDFREFTLHTINVDSPTTCYIFSDGITDQFGGPHGQKFGTKRLKELFLEIHNLPVSEQEQLLQSNLKKWMQTHKKQVDDILVIGFKVDPQLYRI